MNCQRIVMVVIVLALVSIGCVIQIPSQVPTVVPTHTPTKVPTLRPPTTLPTDWTATINQVSVNVRAEPDAMSESVGYVYSGDRVTILSCSGDWCKIEKPAGYIFRGCLSDNPKKLGCSAK